MAIILIGMLDEREPALQLTANEIKSRGHELILMDISIGNGAMTSNLKPDIDNHEIAFIGKTSIDEIRQLLSGSRERVTSLMADGVSKKLIAMYNAGYIDGVIAITGMTGAMICLPALRGLPFGLPKLVISSALTMPAYAAKLATFLGMKDITVMHSVVDTVGTNSMVQRLIMNGVGAICGMAEKHATDFSKRPTIVITEFGFCDAVAQFIRSHLEKTFDVVSFHATGIGEQAALDFIRQGGFAAFIDLVPAGFSEHLLGGNRSMGLDRFDPGITMGKPYILAPGGFDMIACGPIERRDLRDPLWVKRDLASRQLLIQDTMRVQARTSIEEMRMIATQAAKRLNRCKVPYLVKFVIPTQGFSSISVRGGALHHPAADRAFIETLKDCLDKAIEIVEVNCDINSPLFANTVTEILNTMMHNSHLNGQPCD